MQIAETIGQCLVMRRQYPTLGLVPTMGFLHDGHLSLVRRAKSECGAVAVSIFVNPKQFGAGEDFDRYPRDLDRDLDLLRSEAVDLVFLPTAREIYPPGHASAVEVGPLTDVLEGAARPGHFRGVATVVCKLFNIVQPTAAYFGQKDAQQTIVVRKMVRDLDMPVNIVVCPTIRESDGLAMSSRNAYLRQDERVAAAVVHRGLAAAEALFKQGERSATMLKIRVRAVYGSEPRIDIEYVSVADPDTLRELDTVGAKGAVLSTALGLGRTRLIDNVVLRE